ncbi:MAG: tRNA lysidine(34) synthetase TilS [Oscillospiraceae bacterium]|nr:tRNA lysidine(34) synthetase TilS [Oscillospiraceae bacterium]
MREKILKKLERLNLIPESQTVIVAVSGGADSMSLLDFMNYIKEKKNINLMAAHINHCLRGQESDDDELLVRNWCESNNVNLHVLRTDTLEVSKTHKCSIETCARRIRYDFLADVSKKFNAKKIMTAHTLSDNVETFLMNLARGSGTSGLASIPRVRNNILRPFLFLNKNQILEYCKTYKIQFSTDSSNFSRKYTRNKIRLDILPKFRQINPSFEKTVSRAIDRIKEDDNFLQNLAKSCFKAAKTNKGFSREIILKSENPVRSRVIIFIIREVFCLVPNEYQVKQVMHILKKGRGVAVISNEKKLIVDGEFLRVFSKDEGINFNSSWEIPFGFSTALTPHGRQIIIKAFSGWCSDIDENLFDRDLLDVNKVRGNSVFRSRRPGDLFFKANRNCTKSLKKFLNEQKVPIQSRSKLVVLADGNNILWIEGLGVSRFVCADLNSTRVIEILIF